MYGAQTPTHIMCIVVNNSTVSMEQMSSTNRSDLIVCAEGYYLSNGSGTCRPLCILWADPPGVGLDSDNIAVVVSAVIALLSAAALLTLALTAQRKTM